MLEQKAIDKVQNFINLRTKLDYRAFKQLKKKKPRVPRKMPKKILIYANHVI